MKIKVNYPCTYYLMTEILKDTKNIRKDNYA